MTPQEIFDYVSEFLLKQGGKSTLENGVCAYRSSDGTRKCAVGCLIPDECYVKDIEEITIEEITTRPAYVHLNLPDYFKENIDLLKALQNCHDFCFTDKEDLIKNLGQVSVLFNLNTDVLKKMF